MSSEVLAIVYRKTVDLNPYANNSRTHSEDQIAQLCRSIREFGFTNPVLVNAAGMIIAGHGRVMAAERIGMDQVPTITLDSMSEAQIRAYVIADNKLALNAGWDEEILELELKELDAMDFDLRLIGFSVNELDDLFSDEVSDGLVDEDDVPGESEINKTITRTGDVWVMGNHRLMCGDSTSRESVMRLMGGVAADMLLTDPPYNVTYEGKTKDSLKIQNDSMACDDFRLFLKRSYLAANEVMKPGAAFYIWHADREGYNFRAAARDVGWTVRQCLVWVKQSLVLGRQDYHCRHEPCLYGWKEGASHFWANDRKQTTVIEFDRPIRNGEHPTMKPVGLFEYLITNNTKQKQIVLDLFGGSGTTMIACEKTGRHSRLMEIDPKYCDVIVRRWENFTGFKAVLSDQGN